MEVKVVPKHDKYSAAHVCVSLVLSL